jgi:hypothetical protein
MISALLATSLLAAQATLVTTEVKNSTIDASMRQLQLHGNTPLIKGFNLLVKNATEPDYQRALRESKEAAAEARKFGYPHRTWYFHIQSQVSRQESWMISGWTTAETYSGGAHGYAYRKQINLAIYLDEHPREFSLNALIPNDNERSLFWAGEVLSRLNASKAKREMEPMAELDESLQGRFVVSKKGLVYQFDHYEVGAYAEGTYEFTVPWSALLDYQPSNLAKRLSMP